MSLVHYPVMLKQIANHLKFLKLFPQKQFTMLDCTLGTGGHSIHLLKQHPNLHILGIDLDPRMISFVKNEAMKSLNEQIRKNIQSRFKLLNDSYVNISKIKNNEILSSAIEENFDIILADFGYNSLHINEAERGFSYLKDGPLDMRYSPNFETCSEIISKISHLQLVQILCKYGQIDKTTASVISRALLNYRQTKPITTTKQIQYIIYSTSIRNKYKFLIKVFQALRIFVNSELEDVQKLCSIIPNKLSKNGKSLVVTFHSLEQQAAKAGFLMQKQNWKKHFKLNSQNVNSDEIQQNVSSRSAKMLVFQPKKSSTKKSCQTEDFQNK